MSERGAFPFYSIDKLVCSILLMTILHSVTNLIYSPLVNRDKIKVSREAVQKSSYGHTNHPNAQKAKYYQLLFTLQRNAKRT